MNEEADEIMSIYGEKCSNIYVPNPEQEFQEKCRNESSNLVEKYFSRSNNKKEKPTQQYVQPKEQPQPQVLNETQQRNMTLNEAAINIAKVIPMFSDKRDRVYLKEIREAIEEMME